MYPALPTHAHDLLTIQTFQGSAFAGLMEVLRRRSTSESGADENELNFSTLKTELPIRSKLTAAIVTWLKEKDAEYNRGEELPAVAENTNTSVY
jgi:hypothetical protein